MNAVQNGKNRNLEKQFPGCLGRMVNLFDLNGGVAGNRLLTDKPHRDGSLSRSQSDVVRMSSTEDQIEDKEVVSVLRRNSSKTKANGTPMKMLIAEEMSKDIASKHNPPSVVAKLMGLDTFPMQLPVSTTQRNYSGGFAQSAKSTPLNYCHHRSGSLDTQMECEYYQYPEQNECKDVYEVWQNQQDVNSVRSKSPQKGRCNETSNDKKVDFVRQKFIEAKYLSVDQKCHQSKQFQDALEVLSSNTDLFLKFLQEPNPMLSEHIYNLQSVPAPSETKRITVLKPSKMVDNCKFVGMERNENAMKRTNQVGQVNGIDKTHPDLSPSAASWKTDNSVTQPTRIVVLKPSTVKSHELKALSSPPCASPRALHGKQFFGVPEDNDAQESRDVAKSITQRMRENLAGHRRDETLLSSVFSNGYIGDESSFNKSENEYAAMNLSDSEAMSPMSRHSWDYVNRFNSPYSCSSLSRASYSPESSVSREAKKRLSERWAMVASNRSHQEQRHLRRSSSTLGEMLALSDAKKSGITKGEGDKELRDSNGCQVEDTNKNEGADNSPKNLVRSKSVPVSCTTFASQLNLDTPPSEAATPELPREKTKERSPKSSLKGKVSNLFFSRNKRVCKQKPNTDESRSGEKPSHSLAKADNNRSERLDGSGLECSMPDLHESSGEATSPELVEKQGLISSEFGLSFPFGNPCENHEQPSPVSVLETSFEEDELLAQLSVGNIKRDRHGGELPFQPIRSNLIDKSPPIGSIARTLSWDDSCVDTATSYSLKPSVSTQRTEEEEREWFFFIQTLLSLAGLDEAPHDSFLSPLDPSLRDKFVDLNEKETLHEAKRRQRRSTRKLVFDCVNAVLMDIIDTRNKSIGFGCSHNTLKEGSSVISVDRVWERIKEWFPGNDAEGCPERMVRQEVVGKGWHEYLRVELESIGKEIEGTLLEEIVQEAVVGLAGTI